MNNTRFHFAFAVLMPSLLIGLCVGQVQTGPYALESRGGGPFDSVDLGNLNVQFAIPIRHKAGRGTDFDWTLSYESLVWQPVTSGSTKQWQPITSSIRPVPGWLGLATAGRSFIGYSSSTGSGQCYDGSQYTTWNWWSYGGFYYYDESGALHNFSPLGWSYFQRESGPGDCGPQMGYMPTNPPTTTVATDGSGYTMNVTPSYNGPITVNLTNRAGKTINPPVVANPTLNSTSFIDRNGNQITSTNGVYTDTLGATALTISGTAPNNTTLSYTAPSGATASYIVKYTTYTVATKFGVSGIGEFGRQAMSLVNSIELPDTTSYSFTYEQTPGTCSPLANTYSANCITGRLASVTLPTTGSIAYAYNGGSQGIESDGSTAGLTRTLSSPGGTWTYSRALNSGTPGPGSAWTTTVTDPAGNQTVINFVEDATVNSTTTSATYNLYETGRQLYQDSKPQTQTNCSVAHPTNCLLLTTTTCYNGTYANCTVATVNSPITQADQYSQSAGGTTRLSETLYNTHGLVTDDKEYDYGVVTGSAPGTTKLIRETATTYATLSNNIYNKPSSVIVKDWSSGSAVTLASSTFGYDPSVTSTNGTPQHVGITGSRGNLTTVTTSTSSTASLSKTLTYYDTGNPYVATDVNGALTTYVYSSAANPYNSSYTASCGNSFPTSINEPLNLSRSAQWNCIGGVMPHATDENSQVVKSDYTESEFWRPADVFDQSGSETTISYIGQTAMETSQIFNSSRSVADWRATIDAFGRPILRQKRQGPGATNYDSVETDYNIVGLPDRSTMPFSAAGGVTNSTAPSTNTTYDALGRVLTVMDANNGTVTNTYKSNDVLQQVSGGQTFQKQFEYDGLGRLTSVCEISGTLPGVGTCSQATTPTPTGYWTKYSYDALGHLLKVTQNAQAAVASQQVRTYAYDWMGRLTSETNPESGTTSYSYDSHSPAVCGPYTSEPGDLMLITRANGTSICYVHDALHRVSDSMAVGGANSYCLRYRYDASSGGLFTAPATIANVSGRLVEAETDSCAWPPTTSSRSTDEWFSYDPNGRLTDVYELTPHSGSGSYYHSKASYFSNSNLNLLNLYSSAGTALIPTQTYSVDPEGRTNLVSAASGQNPVTSVTYSPGTSTAPLGAVTNVTFGSADSDAFTYDPNTGRMKTYTFSVNGTTDAGTLNWNPNGTLQQLIINDQILGTADSQTCTYGYDDVQRVSNVTCGTFWVQNFTYDAFGNISKNVPSGDGGLSFLPTYWTSPPTNRFNTLPGATPQYDSAGNLLTDNLNTYTWDSFGLMATVITGSATVTATYDAFGRMVENNAGGSYTEFVYGPTGKLAKCNGQTLVKAFVALPGGAKAIYNSSGLAYYRHSDWLGSSRLTSTAPKPTSMYSSSAYAPFGEQYGTAGSADASFTGQDQDTVSNLYDFPARRQSPSQGRWISPDPSGRVAVSLTNPQSWNRYAYALNNPLALIDSTGLSVKRHHAHGMNEDEDEDDDDDDDGGGDGGSDGGSGGGNDGCTWDDSTNTINCAPTGNPPCSILVAGSGNNPDSPGFSNPGGINLFPTPTVPGGLAAAATQPLQPPDPQLINAANNEASMGSSIVLTGFSAGASDIAATWNSLPSSTQNQVIAIFLVSPGIPWGVPNFKNASGDIPTYTFQSLNSTGLNGLEENLVNAGNYAPFVLSGGNAGLYPIYPGGVTQINGPGHSFGGENDAMGILPTSSDCPSVVSSITTWDPDIDRYEEAAILTGPDTRKSLVR